ncbi:MAG: glycosyltransferase family 2 protein [Chlorobi bacterium]|nr:glycosyltransferase family 2 protein [Chlorobiota bacterium]
MKTIFWALLVFILYTYLGYPLLLYLWTKVKKNKINKSFRFEPHVSVVIAAHNEEKNIERRIRNLFDQDYPKKKMEVVVVSDGSDDETDCIIKKIRQEINGIKGCGDFLKLCTYLPSRGKAYAINHGVENASGEIIVFGDSRQRFSKDAIKHLVANFNDEKIGCVSGELKFEEIPNSSIDKEIGMYWNFEKKIRKMESNIGSVPGATGAIYAMKKSLFAPIPEETLLDDVLIPMNVCMKGYRTIFDGEAVAYDIISKDIAQEKKRKIRTLAGNWQLLLIVPHLINPLKNPIWINFMSHKIFRLIVPYSFLALLFILLYWHGPIEVIILCLLFVFFLMALLPSNPSAGEFYQNLSHMSRSVILLNYFALLAPMRLFFSNKKLW